MFTTGRITYSFHIKQTMMILTLTNVNQKNETIICKEIIYAVNIHHKAVESVYNYILLFL
jgi:hypothetical protein